MAAATVFACLFFGAISGSGPATTAAVGLLMIPAMSQRGYDKGLRLGRHRLGRLLGHHHPALDPDGHLRHRGPGLASAGGGDTRNSASSESVSIPKLFIAGVIPGLIMALSLLIINYVLSRKHGYTGTTEGWAFGTMGRAVVSGFWSILPPS